MWLLGNYDIVNMILKTNNHCYQLSTDYYIHKWDYSHRLLTLFSQATTSFVIITFKSKCLTRNTHGLDYDFLSRGKHIALLSVIILQYPLHYSKRYIPNNAMWCIRIPYSFEITLKLSAVIIYVLLVALPVEHQ